MRVPGSWGRGFGMRVLDRSGVLGRSGVLDRSEVRTGQSTQDQGTQDQGSGH
jgi:hypothetical protein